MYPAFRKASMALALGLVAMSAQAQKTVTGTVKDANGEPLIGVSVMVDGTSIGTVTDFDGNFTIQKVPDNAQLKLSYVGYLEQKLSVNNKNNVTITLKEDNQQLDELVVVGYGVMKKRDLTGSVASVKAESIENLAAANAMQAMQAKIPGVDIQQSSGQAGDGVSINIRGTRSILAGNGPLILVDGVEYGSTLDINPSDIESMDILKDAASTAIYGSKGANGVVIITTKRGKSGRTKVNLNVYNSWNSPVHTAEMMYGDKEVQRLVDAENYKTYLETGSFGNHTAEEVLGNTQLADGTLVADIYADKSYTNWYDNILENSTSQNYEMSVSGGGDKTNFSVSGGAMFDRGVMKGDEFRRYNGKVNIDHKINNIFKVGSSLLFTYRDNDRRQGGVYSQAMKMTTLTHAYLNDGTLNNTPNPFYPAHCSPLLDDVDGAYVNNIEGTRFFGNAYVEITPMKGLMWKTLFNIDRNNSRNGRYQDYQSQQRYQAGQTSTISLTNSATTRYTIDNTISYTKDFGKHDITLLGGNEVMQRVYETSNTSGEAGANHLYKSSFYDLSKILSPVVTSGYTKQGMVSFFARANYAYDNKYLLSATIRTDGASQLATGNKWATFPSVSAGWRITEEKFMASTKDWLSNLKLRMAYGVSGNASVNAYETQGTLSDRVYYYNFSGTDVQGKMPSNMSNPELTWEKTSQFDLGLDFGFLDGRIIGGIDFYWSRTNDLLFYKLSPGSSVFQKTIGNVGKTKGNGVELSLSTQIVRSKDFNFGIDWSYTHSNDEITELANGSTRLIEGTRIYEVGQRINSRYTYETNGCWNIGEYEEYMKQFGDQADGIKADHKKNVGANYGDPGTIKIVDRDGNGIINADDRRVYNMDASDILGATLNLSYKNWALSAQLYARLGGYMSYDLNSTYLYDNANWGNLDYWTPENTSAKFPSPGLKDAAVVTNYYDAMKMEKADYFKIKDITVSYNMPKEWIKHAFLSRARIYMSMKNFFSWCSVDNYDAERGGSISFPMRKQVVLGVNLEF